MSCYIFKGNDQYYIQLKTKTKIIPKDRAKITYKGNDKQIKSLKDMRDGLYYYPENNKIQWFKEVIMSNQKQFRKGEEVIILSSGNHGTVKEIEQKETGTYLYHVEPGEGRKEGKIRTEFSKNLKGFLADIFHI